MDFFNGWIQGIVVAVIITVIIEMILPEGNCKKYVKIVLGIYVVFSIISPVVGNITRGDYEVSSIINMDKYAKELGVYEDTVKNRNYENSNEESIKKIYIKKLEEDITSKVKNKGYLVKNIEINIENDNSYLLKDITIYLEKNLENNKENINKEDTKVNKVNEIKIENIAIENKNKNEINNKQDKDKTNKQEDKVTYAERKEIIRYLSETYGLDENKIIIF